MGQEAKTKIIESGVPMALHRSIDGEKTDLQDLIDSFDLYLYQENLSINTCITYLKIVKQLLLTVTKNKLELSNRDIENFLRNKTTLYISAIKCFVRFIYFEFNKKFEIIDYPKPHTRDKKIINVLSKKDIQLIVDDLIEPYSFQTRFIYELGLRISEIYKLKIDSIDWDEWLKDKTKFAKIFIEKSKGRKDREVPISPEFMHKIYEFIEKRDGDVDPDKYLFDFNTEIYLKKRMKKSIKNGIGLGLNLSEIKLQEFRENDIWYRYINSKTKWFEKLFRKSSIKVLKKPAHPHQLRASKATHLLQSGLKLIQVRDFLGHTSVVTTQLYTKTTFSDLTHEMEKLR